MASSYSHALIVSTAMLAGCESSQIASPRRDKHRSPTGVIASSIVDVPSRNVACTRPDLTVAGQAAVASLGSPPVQLSFEGPLFRGRDAQDMDAKLNSLAKQILATREREWKECSTASPMHFDCFQWKISTTCELVEIGTLFSVVCINRLADEYPGSRAIDYAAVHVTRCEGSLIFPSFEKALCPEWNCLDELHKVFLRNGLEDSPALNESSRANFKSISQQFYFTQTHIVFLLGEHANVKFRYDERFKFGYRIVAVPYTDMLRISPKAIDFLRSVEVVD